MLSGAAPFVPELLHAEEAVPAAARETGGMMLSTPEDALAARTDRPWALAALVAVFGLAILVTLVHASEGVVLSSDPGFAPVPVPLLLAPAALTIILTLLLPGGRGERTVRSRRPRSVRGEGLGLIALAATFTLLVPVLPRPEDYVLLKLVLFLVVPAAVLGELARRRGYSVQIDRPRIPAWIPLLPALLLGVLASVGPFSPGFPESWPPLVPLLIGASATALTAGLGEELLYRRLLQTRLEALIGPWTGLLAASLLFGLMHAFSHGEGPLWADAARAVALQGTTGLALGLLWARWRRLWPCVLAHVLINGFTVLLHLLGAVG